MIDPKQLAEWQALADKATPGSWLTHELYLEDGGWSAAGPEHVDEDDNEPGGPSHSRAILDAAFISAARTAVPALIAEVLRLREMLLEELGEEGEEE